MAKTIFITGASSGIGRETAKLFQSRGWNVVATMRSPEKETELSQLENVLVTKLDVTDVASIKSAVEASIAKFSGIDVLINNAGYGAIGPLEAFSREEMIRQFNTNVIGLLDVTRGVLPHFRENKKGIIINVSSMGGLFAFPLFSLYSGSKFAVEGISEALSYEVAQFGGVVKLVEPGSTATEFTGSSLTFMNDESLPEYQNIVGALTSAMPEVNKTASSPNVIAEVIFEAATDGKDQLRYAAGDDSKYMIGKRKAQDDETFIGGMKVQFGL